MGPPAFCTQEKPGGLARPFFLILLTRVACPCLSGFWRDRAGIFVLRRLKCPSLRKERERPGRPSGEGNREPSYQGYLAWVTA